MSFKITRPSAAGKRLFCLLFSAVLLISALSGCKKGEVSPPGESSASSVTGESTEKPSEKKSTTASAESTEKPSEEKSTTASAESTEKPSEPSENTTSKTDAEAKQIKKAKKIAKQRIGSDVDLALWYIKQAKDDGSKVSFPYEGGKTAYSTLNRAQKKLYNEMLPKVQQLLPFEYTAKEHGYTVLDNVLNAATAIGRDHPECEIYFDIEEVFEGDTTTALRASYFLPGDPDSKSTKNIKALKKELQIFEEECNLIVSSIPESFSTYDKYRYLAALISIRTTYDNDFEGGKKTSTAYGAIQGPCAICQGYSTAFEYLCKKADLWCKRVEGISQGVSHAWNLVKLESGTYHVDVTWADSDMNAILDSGWQSYFMLTQEEILFDHEIDDGTVATGTPLIEAAG